MKNEVQKIREAVERLKSQLLRGACSSQVAMETRCKEEAYNEVLAILDNMQEEPASEELDAASIAYAEAFMNDVNRLEIQQAKWHERHPEEPVIQGGIKACFIFMRNAFMAGAQWQKEQMMKDATDGQLENGEDYLRIKCLSMGCHNSECDGKFVKLIIIKEE